MEVNINQITRYTDRMKKRDGSSKYDIIGWFERGHKKFWSVPRGSADLKQMKNEDQRGI